MFWDAVRSDEQKMLVKFPYKQNADGYMENFEKLQEINAFLDIFVQQDKAPVHKSKIVGIFFPGEGWPSYNPDLNPIEHFWAIWKQRLEKQIAFRENLEVKVSETWNKIHPEVVGNLYENNTNSRLAVERPESVMTRYREQIFPSQILVYMNFCK